MRAIDNSNLGVVGELDAATPPAMAHELVTAISGATLVELPGIGHAPMAQSPEAFISVISGFLGLAKN
ncbi:MAG: alpha/beta hydrolase [Kaiparowitsia implicata GSE-PSE-MK54-09C]|nr:alpha/beta hydrolase [Kaiparowitsia implicata GSE-PSE-MK54-09C]